MKKTLGIALLCVLLCAFAAPADGLAASLQAPAGLETDIAILAHYSWDYTTEEALAYFTAAGYSVQFGIMHGGDTIDGTRRTDSGVVTLNSLGSNGQLFYLRLELPASTRRSEVLSVLEQVFGASQSSSSSSWILESRSMISLSDEGEDVVSLGILDSGDPSENAPPRSGNFSPEALRIVENARAVVAGSASTAQSNAPAAAGEGARDASEPFSFKSGITFGMTQAEIIAAEGSRPANQDEELYIYSPSPVQGLDAHLGYLFDAGRLYGIMYLINETHNDANLYISDYEQLKAALTTKYGKPTVYKEAWENDLFKGTPEFYGSALIVGHLRYNTIWVLSDVQIGLSLGLDDADGELSHLLTYSLPDGVQSAPLGDTGDI